MSTVSTDGFYRMVFHPAPRLCEDRESGTGDGSDLDSPAASPTALATLQNAAQAYADNNFVSFFEQLPLGVRPMGIPKARRKWMTKNLMVLSNIKELTLENLSVIPEEIDQLHGLTKLTVKWISMQAFPAAIEQLQNLRTLVCINMPGPVLPTDLAKFNDKLKVIEFKGTLPVLSEEVKQIAQAREISICWDKNAVEKKDSGYKASSVTRQDPAYQPSFVSRLNEVAENPQQFTSDDNLEFPELK